MRGIIKGIYFNSTECKGSDENLVFVHGSGCDHKFLKPLAAELKGFNCYLIDLPDHGNSDYLDCTGADDYVEAVAKFISSLANVTLIGHSLGGAICIGVAAKGIANLKRCVIISSGARFDRLDKRIHLMVRKKRVNWIYLIKCLGSLHSPHVLMSLLKFEKKETIIKDFEIDLKLDFSDQLKNIQVPTLIMVSKLDILTIPEYSKKMHTAIVGSRLIYFQKSRHMLPIAMRRQTAELISEFIYEFS